VIVVVEFGGCGIFVFVDELTPVPLSFFWFRLKPGGFLRELSQSCVKDVFVGLYPPPKSENPGTVGVQFFAEFQV
jgi:hypothetical protein